MGKQRRGHPGGNILVNNFLEGLLGWIDSYGRALHTILIGTTIYLTACALFAAITAPAFAQERGYEESMDQFESEMELSMQRPQIPHWPPPPPVSWIPPPPPIRFNLNDVPDCYRQRYICLANSPYSITCTLGPEEQPAQSTPYGAYYGGGLQEPNRNVLRMSQPIPTSEVTYQPGGPWEGAGSRAGQFEPPRNYLRPPSAVDLPAVGARGPGYLRPQSPVDLPPVGARSSGRPAAPSRTEAKPREENEKPTAPKRQPEEIKKPKRQIEQPKSEQNQSLPR
jgi:hypothetical protein